MKHLLQTLPKMALFALLALYSMAAQATVYYVKPSATGTADGLSWANAKGGGSLQAVINFAANGDQVWVMKGSYQLASGTSYTMKEGVKLYGSFVGTEANLTDRHIGSTSADSSRLVGNGNSVILNNGNGLTNAAVLDGFFVTGGNPSGNGGGIYNYHSSPMVSNCIFSGNTSGSDGGGMINNGSSPLVSNCTFSGNTVTIGSGGGMENYSSSSPTVSNCSFMGNTAARGSGGGMSNDNSSSPTISNCSFRGNRANNGGGMGNSSSSTPAINNCIFSGNTAGYLGGGMINLASSPNINNCTFSGNSDGGYGAGSMTNQNSSNPTINNTIIWSNSSGMYNNNSTPTYNYSLLQGINLGGTNLDGTNAANNPLFINAPAASTSPFTNGDYRLQTSPTISPAIDRGSNSLVPSGITTDIAGNARIIGPSVDLGAYESTGGIVVVPPPSSIYYVKPNATGTADGLSWANAKGGSSLQAVINAATNGNQVWVMKGNYPLAAGISYNMKEGVKIYGSFAGTEASLADRHIGSSSADSSRLVGNGASVIYNYSNGLTTAAVLDGFFVTGGNSLFGGGMANGRASPTVSNCIFSGNTVNLLGGGMSNADCSPIINNCTFSGNTQTGLLDTTELSVGGGGMSNADALPIISNCIFSGNKANGAGGGMRNDESGSPTISNCTFSGNSDFSFAGAMYNAYSSNPTINNTILWGNSTGVSNYKSTPAYNYSLVQGLNPVGTNLDGTNAANNPFFVNAPAASTAPFTNGDYRLQTNPKSPAIDRGSNSLVPSGITTDVAGNARIIGTSVDMGAYESTGGIVVVPPPASIYYVKPSATGTADGLSWANAKGGSSLQAVINAAASGDQVWVMKGSYPLVAGISYNMKEGVKLYGSFVGTETSLAERHIGSTSADSSRLVGNGASVIYNFNNGLTNAAVLDGFFITGGNSLFGGGMFNGGASPTVSNCIFSGNIVQMLGGGMLNDASPTVNNCIFSGNTQTGRRDTTELLVGGGGMFNSYHSSPIISNCIFSGNKANGEGGGMYNSISSPTISNCTFSGNTDYSDGGAIWNENSSNLTINNTIIWGNVFGIHNYNSTTTYNYSLVQGLNPGGTNLDGTNFANNPLFVNAPAASTAPFTNGDYRLQSCSSPCVNVGSNALVPASITKDLAGNARIVGGTVDLGAFELGTVATANSSINVNQNGTTVYAASNCQQLATVQSTGASPIAGSTTAYVWLDAAQNTGFVTRHYQITPDANAGTATGTITLYATQAEFDAYNAVNSVKLPNSSTDATGIANLVIEKHGGTSSDGTGLPGTYSGSTTYITPSAVVYSATNGRWEITFNVTGFSGFFIKTQPSAVLPLSWLSVKGTLNNMNEAVINWQVAEQNVAGYDVEKSTDGRSFGSIGKVAGKGNGNNSYSFTEPTPLNGMAYYRIKQTDANGNYTYSAIVKLTSNSQWQTVSIYPNPAKTLVTVNVGSSLLHTQAMLMNINGQAEKQINIGQSSFTINVTGLPPGTYVLKMIDGRAYKIIVSH